MTRRRGGAGPHRDSVRMSAEIIAIANHKGGQTKTFTAVNLASGLAHASSRVLLVDCDAQANSTSMFVDDDDALLDLFDVVKERKPVELAILQTRVPRLDLLPATLALARLDQELMVMHMRESQIRRALEPVHDRYDIIILDLSPNRGATVIAALAAASSLLVPMDASKWGRRGVAGFLGWSEDLREAGVLTAELLGVLLTKLESGTRIGREIRGELHQSGLPIFSTIVPRRTGVERMVANRLVLGDDGCDEDIAEAYAQLTIEVLTRINEARARRGRHARPGK
jgi:chromosome partitioning protein